MTGERNHHDLPEHDVRQARGREQQSPKQGSHHAQSMIEEKGFGIRRWRWTLGDASPAVREALFSS
jgi:hypothetical protein